MAEDRDELHRLVDQIPEGRLPHAIELIRDAFFPLKRAPGQLPSFVAMMNSGDPDFAAKARRRLYEQDGTNGESGSSESK